MPHLNRPPPPTSGANFLILPLAVHCGLGGSPFDGFQSPWGLPGTPNGRWRSPFGRMGAFCRRHAALRPSKATDKVDPRDPWQGAPRVTDLVHVMDAVGAWPGVIWAPPLELKPFELPADALAEPELEPEGAAHG